MKKWKIEMMYTAEGTTIVAAETLEEALFSLLVEQKTPFEGNFKVLDHKIFGAVDELVNDEVELEEVPTPLALWLVCEPSTDESSWVIARTSCEAVELHHTDVTEPELREDTVTRAATEAELNTYVLRNDKGGLSTFREVLEQTTEPTILTGSWC